MNGGPQCFARYASPNSGAWHARLGSDQDPLFKQNFPAPSYLPFGEAAQSHVCFTCGLKKRIMIFPEYLMPADSTAFAESQHVIGVPLWESNPRPDQDRFKQGL